MVTKMKNRKKKGKIAVILGAAAMLCVMTGCGKDDGDAKEQAEDIIRIEDSAEKESGWNDESGKAQTEQERNGGENVNPENSQEVGGRENAGQESGGAADDGEGEKTEDVQADSPEMGGVLKEIESETELEGSVKSVGENSIVISKIHQYVDENSGNGAAKIAVNYVGGGDSELITVYFSENTRFVVRTVKNGGVNGDSDVEDRDGTVSDVQEGNTINMTGGYEGEDFRAEQIIIYRFV